MTEVFNKIRDSLVGIRNYAKGTYLLLTQLTDYILASQADDTYTMHITSSSAQQVGALNSKVTYTLKRPIAFTKERALIAIRSGSIPRSFFVVDSTNCRFNVVIDSTTYELELTHGNYDAKQLTTVIADIVNTATSSSPSLSLTYDRTVNKFTWTFASTSSSIVLDTNINQSAYKLLGEPKDLHTFTASGVDMVHTSENVVNVTQINSLQIHINNLIFSDVFSPDGDLSNIVHKVYFDKGYNTWQTINEQLIDWKTIAISSSVISSLDISMTTEDGYDIDFNGLPWELTFLLKTIKQ